MAFYYYTAETIKEIDPQAIPDSFREYYADLSEEMRSEIKEIHPDLYAAMNEKADLEVVDFDLFEDSALSIEEQKIINDWESINTKEWHKDVIETEVLVCKVIPDGVLRCKVHRVDLIKKQITYRKARSIYSHYGYLCPECMTLYIEESKIGGIIENLDKRNYKMWIQPVEDTVQEWNDYVEPTSIGEDTTIYIPDNWADIDMRCPVDGGNFIPDTYKLSYKERSVRFDACQCKKCKKIMMRNSLAQQLNLECGRVGVPEVNFEIIKPLVKKSENKKSLYKPDYFIQNGIKTKYDYNDNRYEELSESAILVVSYSRVCTFDDHDSDDSLVLIRVDEKRNGRKEYLILVGYCGDCDKYYIAKEDYDIIYSAGRPNVTIYDDTCSDYYIQSGTVFNEEKKYLFKIESGINIQVNEIKGSDKYISQYETGDNQEERKAINDKKDKSLELEKKIDELLGYKYNPYVYRVDITDSDSTSIYYFGASEFDIGEEKILSMNSDFGKKMVNYRTIEVLEDGKKYKVKRRRQFDIQSAQLFGYIEQSDEDAFFREGLTDPYFIKILNARKKQHQLTDIMILIQENQNTIVDAPIENNIIVQGCAGSGKTVVMLQRLSALNYRYPEFDFKKVIILTPNENFNTHINGLASSLQLGYVERVSVEKYYESLLEKYNEDFKLKYAISEEINVNQVYVDFIYSDNFLKIFLDAYDDTMDKCQLMFEELIIYSKTVLEEKTIDRCLKKSQINIINMLELINELNKKIENVLESKRENDRFKAYEFLLPENIEEREQIVNLFNRIEGFTVKSIYSELYENASKKADDFLYQHTGKRYVGGLRGTHRYDLYLELIFAQKLYGWNAGENSLICIDEGQDLCLNEYRLISGINSGNATFNIFGDTNQLLKKNRGISDWNSVKKYVKSPKVYVLNENFRNTNQITQFCNENFKMNITQTGVDGHKVNEIIRNKFEEKLSNLSIGEERVAILLPRVIRKKNYIDLEQLPPRIRDIVGDKIGNGRICVSYVDEVKGVEFDIVFVVPNGMSNNEKYIAYTRALSELTIVFDEELEEKIKEKEERVKEQKRAIESANCNDENEKMVQQTKTGGNINFGKVKSNKEKVSEYVETKIAYTFSCRRCHKTIELVQKEVDKYNANGLKLPKTCPECKKILDEEINIGECRYCGKVIRMKRGKYEHLKKEGKLILCCNECSPKIIEEKQKHGDMVYQERECIVCFKKFTITYAEKESFEKKGWALPNRCLKCRKRKRELFR